MVRIMAGREAGAPDFQALAQMPHDSTPRAIIKGLLRNEPPPRPLLMPIIFSLGARLENQQLRDFQSNPTKISNALRQIRSVLKVDGLACYFDPFLEAEALGSKREWLDDGSCRLLPPAFSSADDLRRQNSFDSFADKGRIPVARQVIQRLKVMLKDEPALISCVSGPFTFAAQLAGQDPVARPEPPQDLVEFAAEVGATVSKSFLEAGADVVFLRESWLPEFSPDTCRWYSSLLAPIANVIRFYEALPVLLLGPEGLSDANRNLIAGCDWDCVLCPFVSDPTASLDNWRQTRNLGVGCALPLHSFACNSMNSWTLDNASQLRQCLFLTSSDDLSATTEIPQLTARLDSIRQFLEAQHPLSRSGS
ncbi:MAG: uroporphyrinogen decarboxylase family protein [Terriglobales bacterium]